MYTVASMGKTDTNNLGQYFTPINIAEYMTNIVMRTTRSGGSVLDPCIGKNIFFNTMNSKSLHLYGVEIDQSLIKERTKEFYGKQKRKLIIGDFLDQDFDQDFDSVIMNPPYTRQEKVSPANKEKLKTISHAAGINLSAKSNLYVYFLLKGLMLTKKGGLLVAITYDSWLYSAFGMELKRYLLNNHYLKQIIHYKHDAFEGVDVGATIIVIQKGGTTNNTEYTEHESARDFYLPSKSVKVHTLTKEDILAFNDHTVLGHPIEFPSEHFTTLGNLSDRLPWRGTSSPSNKHFLFRTNDAKGLTPVLKKTPKDAYGLSLKDAVYALAISPKEDRIEVHEHLEKIKQEALRTASDSLKEKIRNDPFWYKFIIKPGGEIIFNYYFRNNPRFILNPNNIATMGNYYNISCPLVMYETFSLLNSSVTRYALLRNSKNQGNGLLKIQLYKFNQIPVLSLSKFTKNELEGLNRLGKLLSQGKDVIEEIDSIILKRYCQLLNKDYTSTKTIIDNEINK